MGHEGMKLKLVSVTPEGDTDRHTVIVRDDEGNHYTYVGSVMTSFSFDVSSRPGVLERLFSEPPKAPALNEAWRRKGSEMCVHDAPRVSFIANGRVFLTDGTIHDTEVFMESFERVQYRLSAYTEIPLKQG